MSTSASMSTANITRNMGHPLLKAFCRLLTRVVPPAFAEKTKNAQFLPAWTLVPPVWIEQTTCRLQGGCSATELRRRRSGLYATSQIVPAHPIHPAVPWGERVLCHLAVPGAWSRSLDCTAFKAC